MASFDIISEVNKVELTHAVDNTKRELDVRFDFKGVDAEVTLDELIVTIKAETEFQLKQIEDIFHTQCAKRRVDITSIDADEKPTHSGKFYFLKLTFKQGIEQALAKKIIKLIKDNKYKVQSSIQGDKIRVTGKKLDDLQAVIAYLKQQELDQPLQFDNFRN